MNRFANFLTCCLLLLGSSTVDTGTDPSAIDLATVQELALKISPVGGKASGGGSSVNLAYATKLPLVELGGLTVKDVETLAIDLSKVNHVVRFYSQSPFPKTAKQENTARRTVLSFRYKDNVLIDDVFVNGKKLVGNLDTGSSGSFNLTPAAVTYLGLEQEFNRARVSTSVGKLVHRLRRLDGFSAAGRWPSRELETGHVSRRCGVDDRCSISVALADLFRLPHALC